MVAAMQHERGYEPVKVPGREKGANITVGGPLARAAVKHGAIFAIGHTDARSLAVA